jgi:hypothetical protein
LDPGACPDGSARIKGFERRSHGDHNPRHGGQLFMADDNWHHLEGTFVQPNIFRVYFYDDFTRPLAATGFSATVAKTDTYGRDIGAAVSAKPGRMKDRNTLEVSVPNTTVPVSFAVHVKFKPDDKERVFDFTFSDYSKEVAPKLPPPATPPAQPAQPAQPASNTAEASVPSYPYSGGGNPVARDEALPSATPELLAELAKNTQSVKTLLDKGDLAGLWYPAIAAKDIALALEENHIKELPEIQQIQLMSAVRRLTLAAWQIDAAGDLGNKEKVMPLYRDFSAASADIQMIYGTR